MGRRQPACSSTVDRLFLLFLIVSFFIVFYLLINLNKIYVLRKSGMCHEIFESDDEYAETLLLLFSLSVSSRELNSNLIQEMGPSDRQFYFPAVPFRYRVFTDFLGFVTAHSLISFSSASIPVFTSTYFPGRKMNSALTHVFFVENLIGQPQRRLRRDRNRVYPSGASGSVKRHYVSAFTI